jgi:hypothetical protein
VANSAIKTKNNGKAYENWGEIKFDEAGEGSYARIH